MLQNIIEYVNIIFQLPLRETWSNGVGALTEALELETNVTKHIQDIIRNCEKPNNSNFNDYHVRLTLSGKVV